MSRTFYEQHLAHDAYRASRERRAALIFAICGERLAAAERVVDLGAGTGIIRKALEARAGRPIIGFDIDRGFMRETERMAVADLENLPVRDGGIDFGIANHVYEHVADLDRFFAELRRVLAPGGRIYLTAGNRFAPIEPHYRIPTLSWWPRPVATRLLRWSGRGDHYADIHFTTHRHLRKTAGRKELVLEDLTERVLADHLDRYESRAGRLASRLARRLPAGMRRPLLEQLSPQWFFYVRRAEDALTSDDEVNNI